jgi:hypothetical protein
VPTREGGTLAVAAGNASGVDWFDLSAARFDSVTDPLVIVTQ